MTEVERLRAVENAIAQQTLEGLVVPEETIEDLHRYVRGEITIEECIAKALKKYQK